MALAGSHAGSASVSLKRVQDIPPFIERLQSIARENIRVRAHQTTAVSYEFWKVGSVLPGSTENRDAER